MKPTPSVQAVILTGLSLIFALGYNIVRSDRIPLFYEKLESYSISKADSLLAESTILISPEPIDLDLAKNYYDRKIMFIDARDEEDYTNGHIKGAVLAPAILGELWDISPPEFPIVVYCSGGHCELSWDVANELTEEWNYEKVFVFLGGWDEWQSAGYPTE
ncbi:MAG: rhodanese-like domain-containing protein [Fidelibacterota bacterium]